VWHRLGLKLAETPADLSKVPARFVDDWMILLSGIEDAEEWRALDAKKK